MKIVLKSILNRKPYVYDYSGFIRNLFDEDAVGSDLTTRYTASSRKKAVARIIAKEAGVLAGLKVVRDMFRYFDKRIIVKTGYKDGDEIHEQGVVFTLRGRATSILQSERAALNVLQRMCGVASEARHLVNLVQGTHATLLNTRKTIPGMRYLEKYSSTVGGAENHRLNLADGILIKENHIMAAGSLSKAVLSAVRRKPSHIKVEVEVRNLDELREAVGLPVDLIMLDNFSIQDVRAGVSIAAGKKPLEVSGGVTAGNIRDIAETGVDYISVGAITHSAKALDLSLLIHDAFYD